MLVEIRDGEWNYREFLGTAFLVGDQGYALTAGHIIRQRSGRKEPAEGPHFQMVAAFAGEDGAWHANIVHRAEVHDVHDVSLLYISFTPESPPASFLTLSGSWEGASCPYQQWSYPEDVLYELERDGQVVERPDLVYFEGYIRRRMSGIRVPTIRGQELFELSETGGSGASGSPLVRKTRVGSEWPVIGIYIGERRSDNGVAVGYAVREDAIRDWTPELLGGRTLLEASHTME
jgi:hypothetical protein